MLLPYFITSSVVMWLKCDMNSVHNNQYTSIEMYMCRYVIYKCVAHTSPGLFSSDPVSILRCLVGLFLGDPVSILRCVSRDPFSVLRYLSAV